MCEARARPGRGASKTGSAFSETSGGLHAGRAYLSLTCARILSVSPSLGMGPSDGLYLAIQVACPTLLPAASMALISSIEKVDMPTCKARAQVGKTL